MSLGQRTQVFVPSVFLSALSTVILNSTFSIFTACGVFFCSKICSFYFSPLQIFFFDKEESEKQFACSKMNYLYHHKSTVPLGQIQKQIPSLEKKILNTIFAFQLFFITGINLFKYPIQNSHIMDEAISQNNHSNKMPYPKHKARNFSKWKLPF